MKDDGATILLKFVGDIVVILLMALLNGFVLKYLWGWFIVPLGVKQIGIAHAIGVSLIVGYLTRHIYKSEHEPEFWEQVIAGTVGALLILLIGYIIHSFM